MSDTPYARTPAALAIDAAMASCGRTAAEVAADIGIRPNHLSMIRRGRAALPAARCADAARALGVPTTGLMADCIASYADNRSWAAVASALGLGKR